MTPEEKANLPYRPCAGVMLVNADGGVFVGQRMETHQMAWQMPQGGIDPGEDPKAAALRELWEETGVTAGLVAVEAETDGWLTYDLPEELIGKVWKGKYRGQKMKWFLLRFQGQDSDVNIETEHQEFSAWRWLPAAELVDNIVPFKRDVYAQVMEQFGGKI